VGKRNVRQRVVDLCGDKKLLFCDGLDEALVGYVDGWFSKDSREPGCSQIPVAMYDREKCIQVLVDRDGMSYEEAAEFFDFNTTGAYVGPKTPVFVSYPEEDEVDPEYAPPENYALLKEALIGYAEGWFTYKDGNGCTQSVVAVYDREKCIQVLLDRGLEGKKAAECFKSIAGVYAGPQTPVFATFLPKGGSHADAPRRPTRGRKPRRARGLDARRGKKKGSRRPAR
jgi:hypothetical protein